MFDKFFPDFMSLPESVKVRVGDSISFSCVIANRQISAWYLDDKPLSNNNTYVLWDGCARENKYCGGTLFIKHASEQMNMSNVSCLVLHETCNGRNVTQSPPATIIGKYYKCCPVAFATIIFVYMYILDDISTPKPLQRVRMLHYRSNYTQLLIFQWKHLMLD